MLATQAWVGGCLLASLTTLGGGAGTWEEPPKAETSVCDLFSTSEKWGQQGKCGV